ncbi:hypothetical protein AB1Y20_002224 [Prymnesium parvum]|uniref:Myosin motor domain-containing protein n=1 Tax=Prymnesium parvum TaxID=97485 RepID=A0AB34J9S0_PRYPA
MSQPVSSQHPTAPVGNRANSRTSFSPPLAAAAPPPRLLSLRVMSLQMSALALEGDANDDAAAEAFFQKLSPTFTQSGKPRNAVITLGHDILDLPQITAETLHEMLRRRFEREVVYTNIGDIVLSVNPFQSTGSLGAAVMARYRTQPLRGLPPHLYAMMQRAYETITKDEAADGESQSIIISGESGAGKTEAMKICLSFLTTAASDGRSPMGASIARQLTLTNPVFECLGNATTLRNLNSSRFGKHFDVQFVRGNGVLLGAHATAYLLEKPRIVSHSADERNYHIFYSLLHADEKTTSTAWELSTSSWRDYSILCHDQTSAALEATDGQRFRELLDALISLGFDESRREQLFRMLALVLHLGNLEFSAKAEQSVQSGGAEGCEVRDMQLLHKCCRLLEAPPHLLDAALCSRRMGGGAVERYVLPRTAAGAAAVRNSICMHVYSLAFRWAVEHINAQLSSSAPHAMTIGLLDIFGFEVFETNGFSQLCINLTNELLHNLFIDHVILQEQRVHEREGIEWKEIDYEDNSAVIALISERPMCIFGTLDDACVTGRGSDAAFITSLHALFAPSRAPPTGHDAAVERVPSFANRSQSSTMLLSRKMVSWEAKAAAYVKPRFREATCFAVRHYAGEVTYDGSGFVEMNLDDLSVEVRELLEVHSQFQPLSQLAKADSELRQADSAEARTSSAEARASFAEARTSSAEPSLRRLTIARDFGRRVGSLLEKLRATHKHYVRCLKPNHTLQPAVWDGDFVGRQLVYSGLLEVAKVRKAGYPYRRELDAFFGYYRVCVAALCKPRDERLSRLSPAEKVRLLLEELCILPSSYRVGKTTVFLHDDAMICLDAERKKYDIHNKRMMWHMLTFTLRLVEYSRRLRRRAERGKQLREQAEEEAAAKEAAEAAAREAVEAAAKAAAEAAAAEAEEAAAKEAAAKEAEEAAAKEAAEAAAKEAEEAAAKEAAAKEAAEAAAKEAAAKEAEEVAAKEAKEAAAAEAAAEAEAAAKEAAAKEAAEAAAKEAAAAAEAAARTSGLAANVSGVIEAGAEGALQAEVLALREENARLRAEARSACVEVREMEALLERAVAAAALGAEAERSSFKRRADAVSGAGAEAGVNASRGVEVATSVKEAAGVAPAEEETVGVTNMQRAASAKEAVGGATSVEEEGGTASVEEEEGGATNTGGAASVKDTEGGTTRVKKAARCSTIVKDDAWWLTRRSTSVQKEAPWTREVGWATIVKDEDSWVAGDAVNGNEAVEPEAMRKPPPKKPLRIPLADPIDPASPEAWGRTSADPRRVVVLEPRAMSTGALVDATRSGSRSNVAPATPASETPALAPKLKKKKSSFSFGDLFNVTRVLSKLDLFCTMRKSSSDLEGAEPSIRASSENPSEGNPPEWPKNADFPDPKLTV